MKAGNLIRIVVIALVAVGAIGAFLFRDRLSSNADDLKVGDCVQLPTEGEFKSIQHTPCTEPHNGEVFHVQDYPTQDALPSDADFETFVRTNCLATKFQEYTGQTFEAAAAIDASYFSPTTDGWKSGDHEIVCYLTPAGGGTISTSYKQS